MRARTLNIVIAIRAAAFALLRYETSMIRTQTVRLSIVVCAMHATLLYSGTKKVCQNIKINFRAHVHYYYCNSIDKLNIVYNREQKQCAPVR